MKQFLETFLDDTQRAKVYALAVAFGVVLGAVQVAFLTVGEQPTWLTVTLAVWAFLTAGTSGVAKANVYKPEGYDVEREVNIPEGYMEESATSVTARANLHADHEGEDGTASSDVVR